MNMDFNIDIDFTNPSFKQDYLCNCFTVVFDSYSKYITCMRCKYSIYYEDSKLRSVIIHAADYCVYVSATDKNITTSISGINLRKELSYNIIGKPFDLKNFNIVVDDVNCYLNRFRILL